MENRKPAQTDVLINTIYMMVLSLELMIRDTERRLAAEKAIIQREKKLNLTRFCDSVKRALYYAERLTDDIYAMDEKNKFSNVQIWQEESNELARLVLMYGDRSADEYNVSKVFQLLRELPGEDVVDEKMLDFYHLKHI